jgi:hypothetical protein
VAKQRFVRDGDHLDDDETVVIRGGRLDLDILLADALNYHAIYGDYGVSVFAARDRSVDELAQQVPLVRFEVLTLTRAGVLRNAGLRLDPTRRNPNHFTLVFDDLDTGVSALVGCEHVEWVNPYHED